MPYIISSSQANSQQATSLATESGRPPPMTYIISAKQASSQQATSSATVSQPSPPPPPTTTTTPTAPTTTTPTKTTTSQPLSNPSGGLTTAPATCIMGRDDEKHVNHLKQQQGQQGHNNKPDTFVSPFHGTGVSGGTMYGGNDSNRHKRDGPCDEFFEGCLTLCICCCCYPSSD
jgi:hypothetical protein